MCRHESTRESDLRRTSAHGAHLESSRLARCLQDRTKTAHGAIRQPSFLRDRLKAIGISPRRAVDLALSLSNDSNQAACKLVPSWDRIEKELSDRLVAPYREYYL